MAKWNPIHWLEEGKGGSIIRVLAFLVLMGFVTLVTVLRTFNGPASEKTFEEMILAKQLALGYGFTTTVRYPEAINFLDDRGELPTVIDNSTTIPDLYNPPLYPMVLGGVLAALPGSVERSVFRPPLQVTARPPGFGGDYFALTVNITFFWLTALVVYVLARRLFSVRVGVVSVLGLILSGGLWSSLMSLNGVTLMMFLLTLAFLFWSFLEDEHQKQSVEKPVNLRMCLHALAMGLCFGLLFLTEYSAGFVLLGFGVYLILRYRVRGMGLLFNAALLGFALVAIPWIGRNLAVSGAPLALAGQEIAEFVPEGAIKNTNKFVMDPEETEVVLDRVWFRGFTSIREILSRDIWVGGAYFFVAFFLAAFLYRYRSEVAQRVFLGALLTSLVLLVLPPFFGDGLETRETSVYLAPLFILFGSGFLFVLIESVRDRETWQRYVLIGVVLLLHAFPLIRSAFEPPRQHFRWPPYMPVAFANVSESLGLDFERFNYGIMSDLPAGVSWYMQRPVWGQPTRYTGFASLRLVQDFGLLVLTPDTLDAPFFSELGLIGVDEQFVPSRGWHEVYRGIASGRVPSYFPLRNMSSLRPNLVLLTL